MMVCPDADWAHDETALCTDNWKSVEGPTLSNDIWNKFGFLPTPPRTPSRDTDLLDSVSLPEDMKSLGGYSDFDLNFGTQDFPNFGTQDFPLLEEDGVLDLDSALDPTLPSDLTGVHPIDFTSNIACTHGQVHDTCTSCEKIALAGSELRHDCMWIGTCTAEAHANQKGRIHHDSTCSHITDLMDSQGSLESVSRFTQLVDDFRDDDVDEEEDDDDATHLTHDALDYTHIPRPDTPSESSETDSDEEVDKSYGDTYGVHHEEEVYTSGSPTSSGLAHSDHTYYCLPPPSPSSKTNEQQTSPTTSTSSLVLTSSDTEDEIDVVSVGSSVDSGYSGSSRHKKRSASSCASSSSKRKKVTSNNLVVSTDTNGSRTVLRIHASTSSSSSAADASSKNEVHSSPAEGVKLKSRRNGKVTVIKSSKRHQQGGQGRGSRKKGGSKSDSDDTDKREIHNSMERLRRVDLRNALEELRILIPDLVEKQKAPKVEILKKASQHCYVVREEERRLLAQFERERRHHSVLIKRLNMLQRR